MKTFMIALGLFLALGAVGGIENNGPLLDCTAVALVGLGISWCGVLMMRVEQLKSTTVNNKI